MPVVEQLIRLRKRRGMRLVVRELLALYGVEIPAAVHIGDDLVIAHRALGTVIHRSTQIGNRVMIYHGVTVGRRDAYRQRNVMAPVVIGDDVVLFPGAVVLGGDETLTLATGSVVGANAVLSCDTGPWEIWAGSPARKVGERNPADTIQQRLIPGGHRRRGVRR